MEDDRSLQRTLNSTSLKSKELTLDMPDYLRGQMGAFDWFTERHTERDSEGTNFTCMERICSTCRFSSAGFVEARPKLYRKLWCRDPVEPARHLLSHLETRPHLPRKLQIFATVHQLKLLEAQTSTICSFFSHCSWESSTAVVSASALIFAGMQGKITCCK